MCHSKKYSLISAFLLVLALSLFSVSSLSAEVVLTDEEYNLIMESLTESKVEIKLLKQDSENLTSDLKATQAQVNQLQIDQAVLKLNYSLQSTSYEKLKKRVDLIWLDRVGFGLLGFGTGIGINELAHKLGGN